MTLFLLKEHFIGQRYKEHLLHHTKVKGSNPAPGIGREKEINFCSKCLYSFSIDITHKKIAAGLHTSKQASLFKNINLDGSFTRLISEVDFALS